MRQILNIVTLIGAFAVDALYTLYNDTLYNDTHEVPVHFSAVFGYRYLKTNASFRIPTKVDRPRALTGFDSAIYVQKLN